MSFNLMSSKVMVQDFVLENAEIIEKFVEVPALIAAFRCGFDSVGYSGTDLISIPERFIMDSKVKTPYIIQVSGDSMAPTLQQGDKLIVEHYLNGRLLNHDIIAAHLNGDFIVKRVLYRHDKISLVSDNKDYPDIIIGENDEFMPLGTVRAIFRTLS